MMNRIRGALCASLILYSALYSALEAKQLVGLPWTSPEDLAQIAALDVQVRFVARRVVLVEMDAPAPALALFADQALPGQRYYLVDHLHASPLQGMQRVYASDGWSLVRLDEAKAALLRVEAGLFLWPLPAQYSLAKWLHPRAGAKSVVQEPSAAVRLLVEQVEAERLQAHVEALSLKDPKAGSATENLRNRFALHPELRQSTEYIRGELASVLGEGAVAVQPFVISTRKAGAHVKDDLSGQDSTSFNVVGVLEGSDPQAGYYVICAHYDATAVRSTGWDWRNDSAPGADDNASGVALVLESARLLAGQSFPWSIRFIAFSGEELGLLGSKEYAELAQERDDKILGVLNFDMIGFNDIKDRLELVTNPGSRWIVEQMQAVNASYEIGLDLDILEDGGAGLSDHAPFWARGYDAMLAIENYLPTDPFSAGVVNGEYRLNSQYHLMVDVPDSLNYDLMRRTTQLAVATLAQYGLGSGLPNLAVFSGDLRSDGEDHLRVRVSNIGLGVLEGDFSVRVSQCAADSSDCQLVYEGQGQGPLAPGVGLDLNFPWGRFGEMVFLVEVEAESEEAERGDNSAFQRLSLIPQQHIVAFPNPFRPGAGKALRFSGLPFNATVRLFAPTGELLWSAREDDAQQRRLGARANEVLWFGVNGAGAALVGSGVYIYTIHTVEGELLKKDRIAVLR